VITNAGNAPQPDNPKDEFEDLIPTGTSFVDGSLTATLGTASFDDVNEKVVWNGALDPGESVTITFRVRVKTVPTGTIIENQGQVLFDADGDSSNEMTALTDDPDTPEPDDPTLSPPVVLKGDPNGDGLVDVRDAILCAEGALALRTLTDIEQMACDVAPPSGVIDGRDVVRIAEIGLGIASLSATEAMGEKPNGKPLTLRWEGRLLLPGEQSVIRLYVEGSVPKGLQAGPEGAIRFDPRVLRVRAIQAIEPYRLLASEIDNERGTVKFMLVRWQDLDRANEHPVLELEVEAVGLPGMQTLLRLETDLALDAQLRAAKVQTEGGMVWIRPSVPLSVERFELRPLGLGFRGYRFAVLGRGIRSIEVEIYDLQGRRALDSGRVANGFAWRGLNTQGQRLANGVYLYVVTVYGANGEILHSEVRKLVLLR
jgi:hypothetical protein